MHSMHGSDTEMATDHGTMHGTHGPSMDPMMMPQEQVVLWSQAEAWLGRVPQAGEDVIIPEGLRVVLDQEPPALGTLAVHGTLAFADTADRTLTADNVIVFGKLEIGTADQPYQHKAEIVLTGDGTDPDVVLADWLPAGHGDHGAHHHHLTDPVHSKALIAAPGGEISLHGARTDGWTQLGATAEAGDTVIELKDTPEGWQVGDVIAIAPTGFDAYEVEERTITAIDQGIITLDAPLDHVHFGQEEVLPDGTILDQRAEVANLSRTITISGSEEGLTSIQGSKGDPYDIGYGGHVMFIGDAQVNLDAVEFTGLGITGELGRYAIHFHHGGDQTDSYVKDVSVHHTLQRGIVIHQTDNLLLEGNVVYDTVGHQYYIEDGVETGNQFLGNLAMLPREVDPEHRLFKPEQRPDGGSFNGQHDDDERSSGFWITNTANDFIGNHVAGVGHGMGYWFVSHETDFKRSRGDDRKYTEQGLFQDNVAHTIDFDLEGGTSNLGYGPLWNGVAFDVHRVFAEDGFVMERPVAWNVSNIAFALGRDTDLIEGGISANARVHMQVSSAIGGGDVVLRDHTFVGDAASSPHDVKEFIEEITPGNFVGPVGFLNVSGREIVVEGGAVFGEEQLQSVSAERSRPTRFVEGQDGRLIVEAELPNHIRGDSTADRIEGFGGNDRLYGQSGDDTIIGAEGNDSLRGDDGNDILVGGAGADLLESKKGSSSGTDIYFGGTGDDLLNFYRVKTANTVLFRQGDGSDTVKGYAAEDGDSIVLVGFSKADLDTDGDGDFDGIDIRARLMQVDDPDHGDGSILDLGGGDSIGIFGRKASRGLEQSIHLIDPEEVTGSLAEALSLDQSGGSVPPPQEEAGTTMPPQPGPDPVGTENTDRQMPGSDPTSPNISGSEETETAERVEESPVGKSGPCPKTGAAVCLCEETESDGDDMSEDLVSTAPDVENQLSDQPPTDQVDEMSGMMIEGSRSDDDILGSDGHDMLDGGWGDDNVEGRGGDDQIDGGRGDDDLLGGVGNDTLSGGRGDDVLFGDAGNDLLLGGRGDDLLFGGEIGNPDGHDVLDGGAGDHDVAVFVGSQADYVFDETDGTTIVRDAMSGTIISTLQNVEWVTFASDEAMISSVLEDDAISVASLHDDNAG